MKRLTKPQDGTYNPLPSRGAKQQGEAPPSALMRTFVIEAVAHLSDAEIDALGQRLSATYYSVGKGLADQLRGEARLRAEKRVILVAALAPTQRDV